MAADRLRTPLFQLHCPTWLRMLLNSFRRRFSSREPNFRTSCPRRFVVDFGCSLRPFSSSLRLPSFVRLR